MHFLVFLICCYCFRYGFLNIFGILIQLLGLDDEGDVSSEEEAFASEGTVRLLLLVCGSEAALSWSSGLMSTTRLCLHKAETVDMPLDGMCRLIFTYNQEIYEHFGCALTNSTTNFSKLGGYVRQSQFSSKESFFGFVGRSGK